MLPILNDEQRDYGEEQYHAEFCLAGGSSACDWDGMPDGFHTNAERDQQGGDGPGEEYPLGVVLTCCECDTTYEPTGEDITAGRLGCPDPDCGGWVSSSALTEPTTGGVS